MPFKLIAITLAKMLEVQRRNYLFYHPNDRGKVTKNEDNSDLHEKWNKHERGDHIKLHIIG